MRIGIGTGPVIAGVVGKKKFIYDLWGDTVNIASRITSEGAPNTIHCDSKTWRLLHERFAFEEPEMFNLKGISSMSVYKLVGRK
jgi:class 3 adenylate cyclase